MSGTFESGLAATSAQYWLESLPLLTESLAAQTPGMTALDVAELLGQMDEELARSVPAGECFDVSDRELIRMYLDQVATK